MKAVLSPLVSDLILVDIATQSVILEVSIFPLCLVLKNIEVLFPCFLVCYLKNVKH